MAFDLAWAAKVHPLALQVAREGSKVRKSEEDLGRFHPRAWWI
jgi:hypothetical protein